MECGVNAERAGKGGYWWRGGATKEEGCVERGSAIITSCYFELFFEG